MRHRLVKFDDHRTDLISNLRDGLARGPLHHSRDFVFGKAMIDAYDLERLEAHQPLVLLSNDVVRETMALGPQFAQWIREDGPDRKFVHYLMRYASYTRTPEIGKVVLTYPAKRIAHFIAKRLIHDPEKEQKKAAWLQAYWNEAVALRGVLPSIDVATAESELEEPPTILMRRLVAPLTT